MYKLQCTIPKNLIRFHFSLGPISVEDLKTIYAHFNLSVPDEVNSRKAVLLWNEGEDHKFVEDMCYIAALLAHHCIYYVKQQVSQSDIYQYLEFSKYISFDQDRVFDAEQYCEENCSTEGLIDSYNLQELAPLFEKYPFIKTGLSN